MRRPRPDVVVSDQGPAAWTVLRLDALHGWTELLFRYLPDREEAVRPFAAFVERRVDVGDALPDDLAEALTYGADMHADDCIDGISLDQVVDGFLDRNVRFHGRIDHDQLDLPPGYAGGTVQLFHGNLRARDAGRRPKTGRAAEGDEKGDAKRACATQDRTFAQFLKFSRNVRRHDRRVNHPYLLDQGHPHTN